LKIIKFPPRRKCRDWNSNHAAGGNEESVAVFQQISAIDIGVTVLPKQFQPNAAILQTLDIKKFIEILPFVPCNCTVPAI